MTSQVAVMNRSAIALASDTAATFGHGQKIYRAAEKLFEISNLPPVGLMLSGAAELMDMPWESLIKTYARDARGRSFARLEQYAEDFLRGITAAPSLFPPTVQAEWFRAGVRRYWKEAFLDPLATRLGGDASGGSRRVTELLGRLLRQEIANWRRLPMVGPAADYADAVLELHAKELDALEAELFRPFHLPRNFRQGFRLAVGLMHDRAWVHPEEQSGLVFAGMGADEPFPALMEFQVGTIVAGRLRFFEVGQARISREVSAVVAPFGITDMVDLFYRGIDPALEQRLFRVIARALAREAAQGRGLGAARRQRLVTAIESGFTNEIVGTYQSPLITAVEAQPRQGLATMAEALINLTALKLRMSVQTAETVGGAIDVAVLSRGDGFTWVKRASALGETTATAMTIP